MTKPQPKSRMSHSLKLALVFQISWVLAATVALALGMPVNTSLLAFLLFLPLVPMLLELITRTRLPHSLMLHYHVFISLSSVAGSAFGVYGPIEHWDTFVHVYSAILLASLGLFAVQSAEKHGGAKVPRWFTVSVILATPLAFGAVWEIGEYLSDYFLGTTTQWGLEDTIVDMIAALAGAIVAAVVYVVATRRKTSQ